MSIRQIYVIENQDWLAPKSNLTDQQAYDAIVDLYQAVSDEQWRVACADLANAGMPEGERHERHVEMLKGERR